MDFDDNYPDTAPTVGNNRAPYRSAGLQISTIRGAPSPNIKPTLSPKSSLEPLKENEAVEKPEDVIYLCDHGCGFSGAFGEVSQHEDTCSFSPAFTPGTPPEPVWQPVPVDTLDLQCFEECSVDGPNANVAIELDPSKTITLSFFKKTPVYFPNSEFSPQALQTPAALYASAFQSPMPEPLESELDAAAMALLWMNRDLESHSEADVQFESAHIEEDQSQMEEVLKEFMGMALELSSMGTEEATTATMDAERLDSLINQSLNYDSIVNEQTEDPMISHAVVPSNDQASMYSTAERAGQWGDSNRSLFSQTNGFADSSNTLLPFTPGGIETPKGLIASYDGKGWVEDDNVRQSFSLSSTPIAIAPTQTPTLRAAPSPGPLSLPPAPPAQPPTVTTPIPLTPASHGKVPNSTPMSGARQSATADKALLDVNQLRRKFGLTPLNSVDNEAVGQLNGATASAASLAQDGTPLNGRFKAASDVWERAPVLTASQSAPSPSTPLQLTIPSSTLQLSPPSMAPAEVNHLRTKYGLPPLHGPEPNTPTPPMYLDQNGGESGLLLPGMETDALSPFDSFDLRHQDRSGLASVDERGTLLGVMA